MATGIWQRETLEILRVFINDLEDTPTYSDERLLKVITVSGYQLLREATFTQDYVVDIIAQSILPDPSDVVNSTNDENFINLICLKAACIIDTGSAIKAANNAIAGKDTSGVSFDLGGVATGTLALLKDGWCAAYKAALDDHLMGDGFVSAAVVGPFRTMARNFGYYNSQHFRGG